MKKQTRKRKLLSLLLVLVMCLSLLPVTALADDGTSGTSIEDSSTGGTGSGDEGTTPLPETVTVSVRRDPDNDSVNLSDMDYPASFYSYVTLTANGVEVPASSCHITYAWSIIGLGARPMNNTTTDEYNYCHIYCPYDHPGLQLTCQITIEYNGQTYTTSTSWNGIYRSADRGSSMNGSKVVVSFDSDGGNPVSDITVIAGETYGPLPVPTKEGYEFVCWMTRGNVVVTANTKVDPIGTQTLYAYWEKITDSTQKPNTTTPTTPTTTAKPTTPTTTAKPTTPAAAFTDVAETSPFKDAIGWAVEKGITNGTTATTFSPSNTCTTRQILTFLWRSAGKPGGTAEGQSELDAAVAWATKQSILPAGADSTAPCTRAAAVTYMWKAAGSPTPAKATSFADVTADASYAAAVSWAVEQGVTKGTTATAFSPANTCTRGQIVTFIYREQAK